MRDSKQIANILFLWVPSACFRATANGWISTKFPTCVIWHFLCFWLKMDQKKWLLIRCVELRKTNISFVVSVRRSVHMDGISWNLVLEYFSNVSGKFKFRVNLTRKRALRHEDLRVFLVNSRSTFLVFLAIKHVSEKGFRENQTRILWLKIFIWKTV